METPEILTKAADVIETRGWYQGGYMPSFRDTDTATCPVCVLAAINVAADRAPDNDFSEIDERHDAAIALADYLGLSDEVTAYEDEGIERVVGNDWNDCTVMSPEQVTKALRECAAELEASA